MSGYREQAHRLRKVAASVVAELDALLALQPEARGRKRLQIPPDVLEEARARIAAGEDPDEVARTSTWYRGSELRRVSRKTLVRRLQGE